MPVFSAYGMLVIFFILFTVIAMVLAFDLIAPIDPFKVFNPTSLGLIGSVSISIVLIASIFVYRPWCHIFCPFGLIGWLIERVAIFRIHVDYDACIACEACAKACPSSVMDAILKRDRTIPDCFSCGSCIESCPAKAISFRGGRRQLPSGKLKDKIEQAPAGDALKAAPEE